MKTIKELGLVIMAVFIGLGIIIGGYFIYKGLKSFSDKDRVVNVKGLAEKEIDAIEAYININTSFSGDIPKEVLDKTNTKVEAIRSYLKTKGYKDGDIRVSDIKIYDSKEYYRFDYQLNQKIKIDRYNIIKSIIITTKDVLSAEKIRNDIDVDLINMDLSSDLSTEYKFPKLNSIKPALIAESTKNARTAGEQFANDSQSKLGKIKSASQGQISIAGAYYYQDEEGVSSSPKEPYKQKVRVVSTIVFFLED